MKALIMWVLASLVMLLICLKLNDGVSIEHDQKIRIRIGSREFQHPDEECESLNCSCVDCSKPENCP